MALRLGAPIPRRWHRCRPVENYQRDAQTSVEICACGAERHNGFLWVGKNMRRKVARDQRRKAA